MVGSARNLCRSPLGVNRDGLFVEGISRLVLAQETEVAKRLAREAGRVILDHYRRGTAVEFKGPGKADPVTQADRDANHLIVEGVRQAFPADAVLAEESVPSADRHDHRRLWCIDPLDGTREFIERNGQFVVMIGLAVDGEAVMGVVYQPTEDVLWWGAEGRAFCERGGETSPLCPSRHGDPREARIVVSRSHRSSTVTKVASALGIPHEEPLGSVGLKVARVASGEADVYLSMSTSTREWDACAPEAILRAAGGRMTDVLGDPLRYNKDDVSTPRGLLATNGALHTRVVEVTRPFARERGWLG
jgi:3'(2'), 5'-bisphosphate nucleotidase